MKKIFLAFILLSFSGSAFALETGLAKWYKNLLKGLNVKIGKFFYTPKVRVTAVAAVRGAKQNEDPMALYWKGSVSEKAARKQFEEKKQFAEAVQKIVDGKVEEGRKMLKEFLKQNPDSLYIKDAREALSKLPPEEKKDEKAEIAKEGKKTETENEKQEKPVPEKSENTGSE